jgi:CHAD domain-containing protein
MAALKLYTNVLPKKETKRLRKTLSRIRKAAGVARDLDVLALSHASDTGTGAHKFLADVRQRRKAAQKPIVAIYRLLEKKHDFHHQIEPLLEKTVGKPPCSAAGSFGNWAAARLRKILQRFFKASPSDLDDLKSLHRLRIRSKELRYAMELLAPAFAAEFREQLYPVVEELQERLGEIHDHAVAKSRFHRWISETESKREAVHLRKLFEQERDKLDKLRMDFASWWTPEFEANLQASFQRLSRDRQSTLLREFSRREVLGQACNDAHETELHKLIRG